MLDRESECITLTCMLFVIRLQPWFVQLSVMCRALEAELLGGEITWQGPLAVIY